MKIESSCNLMEIHLKFWLNIYHKRCWFIRKLHSSGTEQKIKFFIKDFFSKFDQIRMKLRIWSHLLKKSFIKNFIFCAVWNTRGNLINITIYYIILGPFYPATSCSSVVWNTGKYFAWHATKIPFAVQGLSHKFS